ncbi:MAG: phosphoenolpyruvate--protein phosphotransferase [Verrucomicrobia bacterium]|nr:phosphoenolpyruvate--protein phosphotransferase [Verrucomicrobiota bacterium]
MQAESSRPEIRLQGTAAAPGVGRGPVYLLLQGMAIVSCQKVPDVEAELRRFELALESTRQAIAKLRQEVAQSLGESEAAIFDAHLLVLDDVALIDDVSKEVRSSGFNIEFCFQEVVQRYIDIFERMEDDFLRERASDIRDVTSRVMHHLLGTRPAHAAMAARQQVVVARDLTPSETAGLPEDGVLAFVTEEGGRTGHSAIMARSLEIPAVVGVKGLMDAVQEGDIILVDGETGAVVINPTAATLEGYRDHELAIRRRRDRVMLEIALPDVTSDGEGFALQANIGGPEDLEDARLYCAQSVGLYRTENLYLRLDAWPTEAEQYAEYAEVVREARGRLVTFRTLDLGGDKRLGDLNDEANPFMGYRAIRLCLDRPDVFRPQLRAILRAAALGPVAVMFPMISGIEEFRRAKEVLGSVAAELAAEGIVPQERIRLGAMIEIPSVAAVAEDLAREVDFFSVGTNDLVQYLLAVDRGNPRISALYEPAHPAVVRTLERIFKAARQHGVAAAVCGELAGDPVWAPLLIGLGAHELSMAPPAIPEVRFVLRHSTKNELTQLAQRALTLSECTAIKALLADYSATKLKLR